MHPAIRVSVEGKRGCGYRQEGGMYLVAAGPMAPCGKLPIPLDVCPTCHGGFKPTRGWTWINGTTLVADRECRMGDDCEQSCPLSSARGQRIGRVGLLWVGEAFYKTPADWTKEALRMGVSRRISAVPKDFEVGVTRVFMAHRKAIENEDGSWTPGVFHIFTPTAVEMVVTGKESDEEIDGLVKRGISPVVVQKKEPARLLP